MRKVSVWLLIMVVICFSPLGFICSVSAETEPEGDLKAFKFAIENEGVQKFMSMYGFKITSVSDVGDLYEIVVERSGNKNIMYLTKSGRHVVAGALFGKDGVNLTKARMEGLNRIDFSSIPLSDAIVIKKGSAGKKIVMVTDVDCPYCKTAFEWLDGQSDVELYVFLFPLDIHPGAKEKSVKVLCSSDAAQALRDVKSAKELLSGRCDAGDQMLAKHVLVGQVLGLGGTPLFVLGDGRKVEGFNKALIEQFLKGK